MAEAEFPLNDGHGLVGKRESAVTLLITPPRLNPHQLADLSNLAEQMNAGDDEVHDGIDDEENLFVPAGFTYLGQFVDHDLTFDTTSTLNPESLDPMGGPSNLRTPSFDLDCVYGNGPEDQPYMYEGARLRIGKTLDGGGFDDLVRIGPPGKERAVIGDKRNDENSIVCQIQLAMIKFHNKVVDRLEPSVKSGLFQAARNEVRWTYQRLLVEDYLRRLIEPVTYDFFDQRWREKGDAAYVLFTPDKRSNIPLEFSGAAYRFGHSMIRQGYRLNTVTMKDIFKRDDVNQAESLIGFGPLPSVHVIDDWRRFFGDNTLLPGVRPVRNSELPEAQHTGVRLQWAYKIDPTLANPLAELPKPIAHAADFPPGFQDQKPSLSRFNLFRANRFGLHSGQTFAKAIGATKLHAKYLQVRVEDDDNGGFTFEPIDAVFGNDTPLWFYVLAEAQQPIIDEWLRLGRNLVAADFVTGPCSGAQLGSVGGRILMEVFYGLLDADPRSYRNAAPAGWKPLITQGGSKPCTFWSLLEFAGLAA